MRLIRPARLRPGDRVAAVCDSWGGAGSVPHRYEAGVRQIAETFGIEVVPMSNTLRDEDWLKAHPEARAADLMQAFSDPEIKGVFSVIGGDDSIRLLPFLDQAVIRANPKVFLGFSDTTVTHFVLRSAGISSFYGPSILAGFAENTGMFPYLVDSVQRCLFSAEPIGEIRPNSDGWTIEHLEWSEPQNQLRKRICSPSMPWRWLQGSGKASGPLIGGCLEVVDWLRGTPVWPTPNEWRGSLIALETSEDRPTAEAVTLILRACAASGMFTEPAGLLIGRPCTDDELEMDEQDFAILSFVRDELGMPNLPVVTRMDFGHTSPVFTIPMGVTAELDCDEQRFSTFEAAVV